MDQAEEPVDDLPSSEDAARNDKRIPGWVWILAKILIFVFSIFIGKMGVLQQNNFVQMPLVLKQLDPSLFPHDSFVESLQRYPIPMWHWIFPLFKLGDPFSVLATLTVLLRLFVFFAAGRLGFVISGGNRFAELAGWAVFAAGIEPPVASGTVYPYTFEHSALAIGCLLLACAFFFERKPIWFAVLVGCAGFLNLLSGLEALCYFGVMAAMSGEYRGSFKKFLAFVPLALLIMSPAIWMAAQNLGIPKLPGNEYATLSRFNFPGHFFPSSWSLAQWARLAIAVAALLFIAFKGRLNAGVRATFTASILVMLGFILVAYIGADLLEISLFVSLQTSRAADFWFAFAAVVTASYFAKVASEATSKDVLAAGIGAVFLTIGFWRFGYGGDKITGTVILACGAISLLVAVALRAAARGSAIGTPSRFALAALMVVLVAECLFDLPRMKGQDGSIEFVQTPYGRQMPLYNWISQNTPKDARFLIFPNAEDFRSLAMRTPFFTPNEGSALMWDQSFGPDWARRLHSLGVSAAPESGFPVYISTAENFYERRMDDNMAEEFSRVADLDYAVYVSQWPTALPVLYDDGQVKVVKLR